MSTTIIPSTDTPITRIRANNGRHIILYNTWLLKLFFYNGVIYCVYKGPHQPGLDLVDSSVFRTHSGNGQHAATSPRHESNRGKL